MSYKQAALSGFGWQTILKFLSKGLVLIKIMILSRLLEPTDFGLFSLVTIALGLTESFTQTGVNITMLQSKHSIEYFLDTAWVIAIIRGLIISIMMVVLGRGLSTYFGQPELFFLISLASLVPLIKGFINPAIISVYKELSFFADTAYRFSLVLAETLFTIMLVFLQPDVMFWVGALIASAVFEVVISFAFFSARPKFNYISSRAAIIFSQAKGLGLSSLIGYLNENFDNLIVGKILGTRELGLYQNTYALGHSLNFEFAKSIHHSTLPIYSHIHDDAPRIKRAFIKTAASSLLLMLIFSLPLLLFPRLTITFIFSEKWIEAIPLVRWLTIAGLIQGIEMICYTYFLAKKLLAIMNFHMVLTFICMSTLIYFLGTSYGLMGAVIGLALARLITLPYLSIQIYRHVFAH